MAQAQQLPIDESVVDISYSDVTDHGYPFVLSACKNGSATLQTEYGHLMKQYEGHLDSVWGCSLSRNAEWALTASADSTAKLWSGKSNSVITPIHSYQHSSIVRACALWERSNSDMNILTGDINGYLSAFAVGGHPLFTLEPTLKFDGAAAVIRAIGCLSENMFATTYSNLPGVSIWDIRNPRYLAGILSTTAAVPHLEVSRDRNNIMIAGLVDGVKIWNYNNDQWRNTRRQLLHLPRHFVDGSLNPYRSASFYKNLQTGNITAIAVGKPDGSVRLYDTDGSIIENTMVAPHDPAQCLRFSPTGNYYASGHSLTTPIMTRVQCVLNF